MRPGALQSRTAWLRGWECTTARGEGRAWHAVVGKWIFQVFEQWWAMAWLYLPLLPLNFYSLRNAKLLRVYWFLELSSSSCETAAGRNGRRFWDSEPFCARWRQALRCVRGLSGSVARKMGRKQRRFTDVWKAMNKNNMVNKKIGAAISHWVTRNRASKLKKRCSL